MTMKVHVLVHLRKDILDIQGQAIAQAVQHAGHDLVKEVDVGKSFMLSIDAESEDDAHDEIEKLCKETLSNPLLEDYTWEVVSS
jgi:phosphoribosylformylglycinamidine synthase subunit PurS